MEEPLCWRSFRKWPKRTGPDQRPGARESLAELNGCESDLSTSLIAQRLYVSPGTVRSHVASTLKKLNATSRDDAVRMFDA